jgi:hypothetical protein
LLAVAMKRDAFVSKGLRIETSIDASGRWFTCWKPDVSVYCRTRKDLLKFASWPIKTPTGDSLRAWLDQLDAIDRERKGEPVLVGDANVEGSFDPLAHDVDNENTRTVI